MSLLFLLKKGKCVMLSLVMAAQDLMNRRNYTIYWYKKTDNLIYDKQYGLEDYVDFCKEAQTVLPVSEQIPRQWWITDLTVKKVPFTKEEIYYTMCVIPNFVNMSSNSYFPYPNYSSAMFARDSGHNEIPAVAFFNSMDSVRLYYRDVLRIGEIVFTAIAYFFSIFEEISDINIRKFKKHNSNLKRSSWRYQPWSNISYEHDETLPDASISKIFYDCLTAFQCSKNFIRRCI